MNEKFDRLLKYVSQSKEDINMHLSMAFLVCHWFMVGLHSAGLRLFIIVNKKHISLDIKEIGFVTGDGL